MKAIASRANDTADLQRMLGAATLEQWDAVRRAIAQWRPQDLEHLDALRQIGLWERGAAEPLPPDDGHSWDTDRSNRPPPCCGLHHISYGPDPCRTTRHRHPRTLVVRPILGVVAGVIAYFPTVRSARAFASRAASGLAAVSLAVLAAAFWVVGATLLAGPIPGIVLVSALITGGAALCAYWFPSARPYCVAVVLASAALALQQARRCAGLRVLVQGAARPATSASSTARAADGVCCTSRSTLPRSGVACKP